MKHKSHCYQKDPEAVKHGAPCICDEEPSPHDKRCHEYWDRGLNCPHISQQDRDAVLSAVRHGDDIDPGWGQFD